MHCAKNNLHQMSVGEHHNRSTRNKNRHELVAVTSKTVKCCAILPLRIQQSNQTTDMWCVSQSLCCVLVCFERTQGEGLRDETSRKTKTKALYTKKHNLRSNQRIEELERDPSRDDPTSQTPFPPCRRH